MPSSVDTPPNGLEQLRQFVNTLNIEDQVDELGDGAECWLQSHHLLKAGESLSIEDAAWARSVREAFREALAAHHDGSDIPKPVLDTLNDAIRKTHLSVAIESSGWKMQPQSDGVEEAVGLLLVIMLEAMKDGTWERLKVCANDACRWAFYDRSRSRSGKWCSMNVCGNRAKQQTWRQSHSGSTNR